MKELERTKDAQADGLLQDGLHTMLYGHAIDKQQFVHFIRFCSERLDKGETVQAIWHDYQGIISGKLQ